MRTNGFGLVYGATALLLFAGVVMHRMIETNHAGVFKAALEQNPPRRVVDCDKECTDNAIDSENKGPVHDKESAYDLFDRAGQRLSKFLPQDPEWDKFPPQLVLDPHSQEGLLDSALKTKIYDPTEIADYNQGEGVDLELRNIQGGVRDATECEFGDTECFNTFMFFHARERKAWG
jgi:hypothetical protein